MFSSLNHIHTACRLGVGRSEVCQREMGAYLGLNGATKFENPTKSEMSPRPDYTT